MREDRFRESAMSASAQLSATVPVAVNVVYVIRRVVEFVDPRGAGSLHDRMRQLSDLIQIAGGRIAVNLTKESALRVFCRHGARCQRRTLGSSPHTVALRLPGLPAC